MNNNSILYWGVIEQIVNTLCAALTIPLLFDLLLSMYKERRLSPMIRPFAVVGLMLWFVCCPLGDYLKTLAWLTERWYFHEYGDGLTKSFSYYVIYNVKYSFILATIGVLMCILKTLYGFVIGPRNRYRWIALFSLISVLVASAILIESPSAKEYRDAWTAYREQQSVFVSGG